MPLQNRNFGALRDALRLRVEKVKCAGEAAGNLSPVKCLSTFTLNHRLLPWTKAQIEEVELIASQELIALGADPVRIEGKRLGRTILELEVTFNWATSPIRYPH